MSEAAQNNPNPTPAIVHRAWFVPVAGLAIIAVLMVTLASVFGTAGAVIDLFLTFIPAAGLAGVWLLAAWGFGWPLRASLNHKDGHLGVLMQGVLGIAALLWLDGSLGRLGLMQIGGSVGAYIVTAIGIGLLLMQLRRQFAGRSITIPAMSPLWLAATPAVAVLLLAACSAPGWLWATEFGGYDALSYHLQLPKEWMAAGAFRPLDHNVYSYLPGAVEGGFYHLMLLRGDAVAAAEACQMLHASFAIIAALLVGAFVNRIVAKKNCDYEEAVSGRFGLPSIIAATLCIGTPWIIVCGSLAYNDVAVVMLLAAGMVLLAFRDGDDQRGWQTGAAVGVIAGTACACKLTACGFVAAPLVVIALMTCSPHVWLRLLIPLCVAALAAGAPYLIGNWVACGNPVFPFATDLFGAAHWTSEQVGIWQSAHAPPGNFAARMAAAWDQFVRFGIGATPVAGEPWFAQWSILPWVGFTGIVIAIAHARTRRWGVALAIILFVQLAFWLLFTHIKSRFMLPAAAPLAAGAVLGGWIVCAKGTVPAVDNRSALQRAIIAAVLFLWCLLPVLVFTQQRDGLPAARIGWTKLITGEAFSDAEIQRAATEGALSPTVFVNRMLPRGSHVLFLGEAAPFYYGGDRVTFDYQTTYDRGAMSQAIRDHSEDQAAWFAALRNAGYTHLLIDPNMLSRWQDDGWADPVLDTEEILESVKANTRLLYRGPSGVVIALLE